MARRVGRYTKNETTKLIRMFSEGYSIYKICRNLNRSQNSIRNNLIRLKLVEGEISPKQYKIKNPSLDIKDSLAVIIFNYFLYIIFLSLLTFCMIVKPILNPIEMFIFGWIEIFILINFYLIFNHLCIPDLLM